MAATQINTTQLRDTAAKLETISDNYMAAYNNFLKFAEGLKGMWAGAAADAFAQMIEETRTKFQQMFTLLNQTASVLRQIATRYEQAEEEAKRIVLT